MIKKTLIANRGEKPAWNYFFLAGVLPAYHSLST